MLLQEKNMKQTRFMQTYLHTSIEETHNEIYKQAAIRFYKQNVLSLGKAAEFTNITKIEFIDLLKFNNEPIFDYDNEKLEEIYKDSDNLTKMLQC